MADGKARDVERVTSRAQFVAKLRRLADALETDQPFTIQVANERFTVPTDAEMSVEHERGADGEELELQLRWKRGR
jgi:amphi-Trp domain-containing protein